MKERMKTRHPLRLQARDAFAFPFLPWQGVPKPSNLGFVPHLISRSIYRSQVQEALKPGRSPSM